MKKSKYKKYRNYGIILVLIIGVILFARHLSLISVSPYCKSLPDNAVNTLNLGNDESGCPHWYIEIRRIVRNCYRVSGITYCEGEPDYNNIRDGCLAASPPCPSYPEYSYTPIANYGGLLENFECANDLTQTCSDGSKIITKQCIDGFYVNTDNKCNENEEKPISLIIIVTIILLMVTVIIARRKKWLKSLTSK